MEITRKEVVLSEVCSVRCCSMCKQGFCLSAVKSMGEFAEKYWRDIGRNIGAILLRNMAAKSARIMASISVWYRLGVLWVEDVLA